MKLSRRELVSRSLLALGGIGALPRSGRAAIQGALRQATTGGASDLESWVSDVRDQIPASTRSTFLQTAGVGPSPRSVMETVCERLEFENQSPAAADIAPVMDQIEPDLRSHLARSFGAHPDEVALTHSTSEGINIVSWSVAWQADDEVIISNQEHPSNIIPWYNLRDRFGIRFHEIDLNTGTDLLPQVASRLNDKTRMVSLSHVSRNNGRAISMAESKELTKLLRDAGIRYHLDGAQAAGSVAVNFLELGCDYYSTCGHKWLLGPKGTGTLFVRREILDDTLLSWTGAHSHETMDYEGHYRLLPTAARFEFGNRALATFAGFDESLRWMDAVGGARVLNRIRTLVDVAIERVDESRLLKLSSPREPEQRSGIVAIRLPEGTDSRALYRTLREDEGVLASPVRDERDFRLAVHFFNTEEDIDTALAAIERHV